LHHPDTLAIGSSQSKPFYWGELRFVTLSAAKGLERAAEGDSSLRSE
jgi:hypothetical protein